MVRWGVRGEGTLGFAVCLVEGIVSDLFDLFEQLLQGHWLETVLELVGAGCGFAGDGFFLEWEGCFFNYVGLLAGLGYPLGRVCVLRLSWSVREGMVRSGILLWWLLVALGGSFGVFFLFLNIKLLIIKPIPIKS